MTSANSLLPSRTARIAVCLAAEDDYDGWRVAARRLVLAGKSPDDVAWTVEGANGDLFASAGPHTHDADSVTGELRVPRSFPALAEMATLHRDPERFALMYRLLARLTQNPRLIEDRADPLLHRVSMMAKAVRRDMHKMRAFVRFRETDTDFVAWFEPEHHIVRANAGFFVRRFAQMHWSILTPEVSLHWDTVTLREGPGAQRGDAPAGDPVEEIWKTYYASTFNPARLKVGAMVKEMPRKYWKNLPEAELIAPLIAGAQARESRMIATEPVLDRSGVSIDALREEALSCRRCPLWQGASTCVFGEGPPAARLMLVGEQPGDEEDREGRPFVGPAGQLLNRALEDAGVDRREIYVTNAVKHFKYELRGKRRLHQTPNAGEIQACRWWLDQEIGVVRPRVIVMLGASAIRGVTGKAGAVGKLRNMPLNVAGAQALASYHPAYILRLPDRDAANEARQALVSDLRRAADLAIGREMPEP